MKNIVLFGPPGAGKGTQAQLLESQYGLEHLSTGEVIRQQIAAGTPLGRSVEAFIARGELAPDKLVLDIIAEHIEQHRSGAGNIFDGFPRTLRQAEEFDPMLAAHGLRVDAMLCLEVPDEVLVERLLLRATQSGRADDADEAVIRNRIEVYKRQTAIVAGFYERQGKHFAIDGLGSVEEVFARITRCIDAL